MSDADRQEFAVEGVCTLLRLKLRFVLYVRHLLIIYVTWYDKREDFSFNFAKDILHFII